VVDETKVEVDQFFVVVVIYLVAVVEGRRWHWHCPPKYFRCGGVAARLPALVCRVLAPDAQHAKLLRDELVQVMNPVRC
jgi:hypothetical protein